MSEPTHLQIARRYLGVKEIPGGRHSATVLSFFARAGFPGIKTDETPWCAGFANAVLAEAGLPGTASLLARSFLDWGITLSAPRVGAIVVFRRGSSSWQGHVGFVTGWNATHIKVLGGNQSNAVTIANYARSSLLGFRWPKGIAAKAPASAEAVGDSARVTASSLNLRDAPRPAGGDVLTSLPRGTALGILDTWHLVRVGDRQGWVSAKHVQEL